MATTADADISIALLIIGNYSRKVFTETISVEISRYNEMYTNFNNELLMINI